MPPEAIDFARRAELSELMDEPCSREELRACLRDLAKVNRWLLAYRPTLRWLDSLDLGEAGRPIHVLDVGCGYGDTLRRIEAWAKQRKLDLQLTGCDLNAVTVSIAAEATPRSSRIQWLAGDVFSLDGRQQVDIVISSLFTHHLAEERIVQFLGWMEGHARVGWFINDLSRAAIPYRLFKAFSRFAGLHRFVQHDGPVSIARAFVREDWHRMCSAAGLRSQDIQIDEFTPARLCVARHKR
jgi:SAM-dependent methyltransferase